MKTDGINFNLPKVALGSSGAIYLIDADNQRLVKHRMSSDERTIIDFDRLPDLYGQKLLIYNWHDHEQADIPLTRAARMEIYDLIILPEELINLRTIPSDEKCYRLNQESQKNGFGYFVADQDTSDRIQGKLATVDIAGQEFFIDMRMGQLRPKDDFGSFIAFEDIAPWDDGDKAVFLYNTKSKSVFNPHWDVAKDKSDIIAVQTRSMANMDPVGLARRLDKEDGSFLDRCVFLAKQKAAILPIEKTIFRDLPIREESTKQANRRR